MSKALEYARRLKDLEEQCSAATAYRDVAISTAPEKFHCDRQLISGRSMKVTASVQYDGSLELSGWLPADKVADFVKWLGEVYGD